MARTVLEMRMDPVGLGRFRASIMSMHKAAAFACAEIPTDGIRSTGDEVLFMGSPLMRLGAAKAGARGLVVPVYPGIGLPLFVAYVLSFLPPTAWVEWRDGWPMVRMFPREDDEARGAPPILPQLAPA
jgi:hypothetical protein